MRFVGSVFIVLNQDLAGALHSPQMLTDAKHVAIQ